MAGPDRTHPDNLIDAIENVFDTHPEGRDGIGPTLGEDLDTPATGPDTDADKEPARPRDAAGADRRAG